MNPARAVGFMVWCPDRGFPTKAHSTLERALAEAERLTRQHPGQRFCIMAPVLSAADATKAKAHSDGMAEGLAQAHREIMRAERISDALSEQVFELKAEIRRLKELRDTGSAVIARAEHFQSVVADAQCWFDGYQAAHAGQDNWQRPWTPDTDKLRELNAALRGCLPATVSDDEIPF